MKALRRGTEHFILPIVIVLVLFGISHAYTEVGGNITNDTTWTHANSFGGFPIHLVAQVKTPKKAGGLL